MAAIRLSASVGLFPEQTAVKYSRYEASKHAISASASPGVNWKSLKSFTRTLATSCFGAPQQSLNLFPEPHPHGSLRPELLPSFPPNSKIVSLSQSVCPFSSSRKVDSAHGRLWQIERACRYLARGPGCMPSPRTKLDPHAAHYSRFSR